ncbi:hypothetical protein AVEN_211069-1 [Araneus ventricosus]|uniref:Uncharacterized protein n=1 Tax=Araneus ventricosus TaxID=182803 RepID=A0A4Y2VRR4_ARAVE|nr:hypothetical protein AVEN_62963-1 [Araneus ventricosus]GBO26969.1 hypothetical protein AVEN_211069-1 [Araneus ventricosus]
MRSLLSTRTVPIFDASENIVVTQSSPFRCLYCRFFEASEIRFTRDEVYDVSRCIVDIDVHTRCEEHCSRSHIVDRKCAAFLRSSVTTVAYLSSIVTHHAETCVAKCGSLC